MAPVGRWQPGGNRPRQRSDHHVQPPGGDCGQEGRLSSGGESSPEWALPDLQPAATCISKPSSTTHTNPRDWMLLPIKQVDCPRPDRDDQLRARRRQRDPHSDWLGDSRPRGPDSRGGRRRGGTARRGGRQAVRERIGRRCRSRLRQVVGQAFRHAVGTLCDADPDAVGHFREADTNGTATPTPSAPGTATPTPTTTAPGNCDGRRPRNCDGDTVAHGNCDADADPDRNCDGDAGWHGPREAHTHRNGDADTDSHTGPDNDLRQTVGSRIGTAIGYPAAFRASVGISERDGRPPARRRSRQPAPVTPPPAAPTSKLPAPPSATKSATPSAANRLPSRRRRRPLNRSLSKPHPHPAQRRAANRREAMAPGFPGRSAALGSATRGDRCPLLRPPRSRASLEILEAVESAPN